MTFYKVIKELRKEKGLSARDIANSLGLSTNMIYEWEHQRCEPSIDSIIKLSQFFQVPIGYLLGLEDDLGSIIPAGENLSQEEKEVLRAYRALNFDKQRTIRIQLKALTVESEV